MPDQHLETVMKSGACVSYDFTSVGYFLTVQHPLIPEERIVCDDPHLTGRTGGILCGFLVFLEGKELTLECFSYESDFDPNDNSLIPEDFRDRAVVVSQSTLNQD